MPELLPIAKAAEVLGERPGTLRRWIREGLPHQPGRKGAGGATLVDIESARSWRGASLGEQELLALANDIPRLLAASMFDCWRLCDGPDKTRLAGVLCVVWYSSTSVLLNHLREQNAAVPTVLTPPPEIEHLNIIARKN